MSCSHQTIRHRLPTVTDTLDLLFVFCHEAICCRLELLIWHWAVVGVQHPPQLLYSSEDKLNNLADSPEPAHTYFNHNPHLSEVCQSPHRTHDIATKGTRTQARSDQLEMQGSPRSRTTTLGTWCLLVVIQAICIQNGCQPLVICIGLALAPPICFWGVSVSSSRSLASVTSRCMLRCRATSYRARASISDNSELRSFC